MAGRFESINILNNYFSQDNIKSNIYWFHCSSFGEYLQVDPIINGIKEKKFDLSNYSSKNFDTFINSDIKLDYVITVCNNANNEVCPIWPDKNQIIHWDIEDPVKKFNEDNDATNQKKIFNDTYQTIFKKIENWINNEI